MYNMQTTDASYPNGPPPETTYPAYPPGNYDAQGQQQAYAPSYGQGQQQAYVPPFVQGQQPAILYDQSVQQPPTVLYDTGGAPIPGSVPGPGTASDALPHDTDDDEDEPWNARGKDEDIRSLRCGGGLNGPVLLLAILGGVILFIGLFALVAAVLLYSAIKSPFGGTAVLLFIAAGVSLVYGTILLFISTCGFIDSCNSRYRVEHRCTFLAGQLTSLVATALMSLGIAFAGMSSGQHNYVGAVFKLHFEDFADSAWFPALETAEQVKKATDVGFTVETAFAIALLVLSILTCTGAVLVSLYLARDFLWRIWNLLMVPAVLCSLCGFWASVALFAIHSRAPAGYDVELLRGIWIYCLVSGSMLAGIVAFNIPLTFYIVRVWIQRCCMFIFVLVFFAASIVGMVYQIYVPTNVDYPENECLSCLGQGYFLTCDSTPVLAAVPGASPSPPSSASFSASASSSASLSASSSSSSSSSAELSQTPHGGLSPPSASPPSGSPPSDSAHTRTPLSPSASASASVSVPARASALGVSGGGDVHVWADEAGSGGGRGVGNDSSGSYDHEDESGHTRGIRKMGAEGSCADNAECAKVLRSLALYNRVMETQPAEKDGCITYTEIAEKLFSEAKNGVYDLKIASIWVCIAPVIPGLVAFFIFLIVGFACGRCLGWYDHRHGRHGRRRHHSHH